MTDKEIHQDQNSLNNKRLDAVTKYPGVWNNLINQWNNEVTGNSVWLTYSANYLLQTSGVHWAIDPFSMSTRVPSIKPPDFVNALQKLELVALTHAHNDHLDLNLIRAISSLPIQWIIPEDMLALILGKTAINKDQIIIAEPGKDIHFRDLSLTPFDSLHFHVHGGVKETGYLVSFEGNSWLFPGDIREFNPKRLPPFGSINGVFAHLWLGKACALQAKPPFLNDFCDFFSSFSPKRIIIAHLNEYGRDETELWDETHFALVQQQFFNVSPQISIEMALMGSKVILS
jgi:hypothetical protein